MKVLMMHRNDGRLGGAQVQMHRLREGLRGRGVDARVLCREVSGADAVPMPWMPSAERAVGWFTRRAGWNDIHLLSSHRVAGLPAVREADVLDLHCLHSGTFSYLALPGLSAAKPVVFTVHDMWPFTGHCHASLDCDRWKSGCGRCPYPETEPAVRRDGSAIEWRLKKRAYEASDLVWVAPSRWLAERMQESMLGGRDVRVIPHGVDPTVFRPHDKTEARKNLGISPDATVLGCVIDRADRPLKGADLLRETLGLLPAELRRNCVLLFAGHAGGFRFDGFPVPVVELGYLGDEGSKALAYSAADLLVNPSRAESFGLVVLEAMACGTPAAAFAVGGVAELIEPDATGWLARPGNPRDLAACVAAALADRDGLEKMSRACRERILRDFTLERQVDSYVEVYRDARCRWSGA
ncbi:MAG: glycosyltransferase [Akkermansiaceae bacterium]|nr:glycosyltransferase [Akkermansiaceae bacterium]